MSTVGRPTVPWSWYSDPAIHAMEMEQIFRRSWQYAGHLGELQGPGSYFASETGPVPIVITLDADGELRGFVNVCRHRGAIVATDARKRGTIQCPYHAWTYGLDGCLRAAPRADEDPDFDSSQRGLLPVSVETWGPFVFANPDPDADPLSDALGDLPEVVAERGLDVDSLKFNRRVPYEIKANWKIAIENYLECIHCPVNHPSLLEVIDERRLGDPSGGSAGQPVQSGAPALARWSRPHRRARRAGLGPVPHVVPDNEVQRATRSREPLDRAAVAHEPGDLRGVSRLLVRRYRRSELDRRRACPRRAGRRRGHRAGRSGPARGLVGNGRPGLGARR